MGVGEDGFSLLEKRNCHAYIARTFFSCVYTVHWCSSQSPSFRTVWTVDAAPTRERESVCTCEGEDFPMLQIIWIVRVEPTKHCVGPLLQPANTYKLEESF